MYLSYIPSHHLPFESADVRLRGCLFVFVDSLSIATPIVYCCSHCLLLLQLFIATPFICGDLVFGPCFAMQYLVCSLVLQSLERAAGFLTYREY